MLLLDCNAKPNGPSLLEAGTEVNVPDEAFGQSPAHLAARGGHAFFLLWQLQTGANLNQQDWLGEAPIHKAAKVGSLECLTFLVASHANIDLCNNNGQTAEDLAWAFGFSKCAQFLMTVKHVQNGRAITQCSYSLHDNDGVLRKASTRQKRACESWSPISKKRVRSNDTVSPMSCER
ncbi:ankyrin repeat domain-containing protein 37 [Hemicordylus capensis]|uniref:ankyrin repeat domain-containing protein 37 n=1 Tax=Hemicordylus capensis TaxID=884348 RepID=UPI00230417BB|nr:ankyrin repeat domain-containing protein 37 [Hemicordylus capensis]XP_053112834.1 ankyrin repeat domain-containing protein 37 [Hemicordylus capensis]